MDLCLSWSISCTSAPSRWLLPTILSLRLYSWSSLDATWWIVLIRNDGIKYWPFLNPTNMFDTSYDCGGAISTFEVWSPSGPMQLAAPKRSVTRPKLLSNKDATKVFCNCCKIEISYKLGEPS